MDNWEWKRKFAEEQAALQEYEERERKRLLAKELKAASSPTKKAASKTKPNRKPKGVKASRKRRGRVRTGLLSREAHDFKAEPSDE